MMRYHEILACNALSSKIVPAHMSVVQSKFVFVLFSLIVFVCLFEGLFVVVVVLFCFVCGGGVCVCVCIVSINEI